MARGKGTLNKVMLIGRLGSDPELKYTASQQAVTTLSLATSEAWKDKDGNAQERTEWHRIVLWQKSAEIANEYLKKGSRIFIEGRLQTRSWEDQNGNKKYTTEIVAQNFEFLDSRPTTGGNTGGSSTPPPPADSDLGASADAEDDLPF